MKIIAFEIIFNDVIKTIPLNDKTLFYSKLNSTGKTTLLRSLIYALGYNVQNTANVDFSKFQFHVVIVNNDATYDIYRNDVSLKINEHDFDLPVEENKAHAILFGTSNDNILNNILGSLFIDQDYGWSIIGHGRFAGDILYSLSCLVEGLNDFDDGGLRMKIAAISKEIKKYRFVLNTSKKKDRFVYDDVGIASSNNDLELLTNELNTIKNNIKILDGQINKLNNSIRRNNHFSSFVSEMKLTVLDEETNRTIPINQSTLYGFKDNNQVLEYRKLILQNERSELKKKEEEIENKLPTIQTIENVRSVVDIFLKDINGVDEKGLESTITQLETEKRRYEETLKELNSYNNLWIDKIVAYAKIFGDELGGLSEDFFKDSRFIYAKKRPSLSGAILHKLSLAYHLAAVKACEEKLGFKLPLFIDSPGGRELVGETLSLSMNLIKKHFSDNQVFIATIHDLNGVFDKATFYSPDGHVFDFDLQQNEN